MLQLIFNFKLSKCPTFPNFRLLLGTLYLNPKVSKIHIFVSQSVPVIWPLKVKTLDFTFLLPHQKFALIEGPFGVVTMNNIPSTILYCIYCTAQYSTVNRPAYEIMFKDKHDTVINIVLLFIMNHDEQKHTAHSV